MIPPFPTTQWTEFFALRDGADPEGHRLALSYLYGRYWSPLYAYLRRRGFDPDQSADLLQSFFAFMLDRNVVSRLDLTGRLRAFLIAMLRNHVADQLDRDQTLKRSPSESLISLDLETAEQSYRGVPSLEMSPEEVYEQRWALEMVTRAEVRLEKSEASAGRSEAFSRLREHVYGSGDGGPYRDIAAALEISESAVKVRIHRLRKRFGRLLREDIALTVDDSATVDDELRFLLQVLGKRARTSLSLAD
jgi:RNA polymerase sigma-70 factor (ECF subfamily)